MSVLLLRESDVQALLDMPATIEVVEEAFRRLAAGEATNVPRVRAAATGIVLHSMSAGAAYLGFVGWKNYTTTRDAARFLVGLHEQSRGSLVALIEADHLGRLRTGATTGVAVKHLAPPEADEVGLFGAGRQAATQLQAVAAVRPIRRAFVSTRKVESRQKFAAEMSTLLNIDVTPVDEPRQAVEGRPIIVTATTSARSVFDGRWVGEGATVCAVGSNWLNRAEVDVTLVERAAAIVCDSVAACRHEAGDFTPAIEQGRFAWSRAVELADVVAGKAIGRARKEDIVLFKSVGLAIEDVALAAKLVELARQQGVGESLPL